MTVGTGPDNVRYMYVRDERGRRRITVVFAPRPSSSFDVGWAVWNPVDRYDKKRARSIALGRLYTCPISVCIPFNDGVAGCSIRARLLRALYWNDDAVDVKHPLGRPRDVIPRSLRSAVVSRADIYDRWYQWDALLAQTT